ncbi:MAG: endonuclease [Burkholderiaceae bacterium]|nr:endonuclease [Burkholderiaceae bacterium]
MKLVTWNIQWCRGCDGRVDPARIVAHARALADFDVLCLQEVASNFATLAGSAGEDQFGELARLLPGFESVPGIAVDVPDGAGGRRRFGNLILSRLPVLRVLRHQLPWPPVRSKKEGMPRMLLEAVVRAPFGEMRVMTTHLEYYSGAQRTAQVAAIRDAHEASCRRAAHDRATRARGARPDTSGSPFQWLPHPASAVLTGDFNFRPDDPLHARMQASFGSDVPALRDGWEVAHPGVLHAHTLGVHDREQWPSAYASDFVFLTEDLVRRVRRVVVDGGTQASDHQPVLIELS